MLEGIQQTLFYVVGDEPQNIFEKVEGKARLTQVIVDGSAAVGKNGLCVGILIPTAV